MGREVEAASAPLFVSTASVLNTEFVERRAEVEKCSSSGGTFLLSLSAGVGEGGGGWETRKGHTASCFCD